MTLTLTYNDDSHRYRLNGVPAKSVTGVAKIPVDEYSLVEWKLRQVAIGLAMDRNLIENVAAALDNREAVQQAAYDAMKVADPRRAAERGTQMHKVLELVLSDRPHLLVTAQQERDAAALRRTLDRYGLTPVPGMTEQFVAWPKFRVTGRFDAVLERPNGENILVDLKSGENAVRYPQSVAVQLALYARAGHVSRSIEGTGNAVTVTEWHQMPAKLDRKYAYVMLVEPDTEVGTLHRVDIEHGYRAALMALELADWQRTKAADYVSDVPDWRPGLDDVTAMARMTVESCTTVEDVRALWKQYAADGHLTPGLRDMLTQRADALRAVA